MPARLTALPDPDGSEQCLLSVALAATADPIWPGSVFGSFSLNIKIGKLQVAQLNWDFRKTMIS